MRNSVLLALVMALLAAVLLTLWGRSNRGGRGRQPMSITAVERALDLAATLRRGQSPWHGTTTVLLTGATGVTFTLDYVLAGRTLTVTNSVPFHFTNSGVSEFEVRKLKPDDLLSLDARYDGSNVHGQASSTLGTNVVGIRYRVREGLSSETIPRPPKD